MAREYEEYLREKVSAARRSKRARQGFSNDKVEAYFAAKRARTFRARRKGRSFMNEYLEMILVASPLLIMAVGVAFAAYWITRKK